MIKNMMHLTEINILDDNSINELKDITGNDSEFIDEVINLYIKQLPALVQNLKEALKSQKQDALKRTAHTLKGASRNIGALRLGAFCEEIENSNISYDTSLIIKLTEALDTLVKETTEEITNKFKK